MNIKRHHDSREAENKRYRGYRQEGTGRLRRRRMHFVLTTAINTRPTAAANCMRKLTISQRQRCLVSRCSLHGDSCFRSWKACFVVSMEQTCELVLFALRSSPKGVRTRFSVIYAQTYIELYSSTNTQYKLLSMGQ